MHTMPVAQVVPGAFDVVALHTGAPDVHTIAPFWH